MGIAEENYQWGYRTSHCFAVENRYRTKGSELGAEREQFRDLVQAFHDQDIAVIIDIVPNHTAEDMDDEPHNFHFNVLDKLYYYRTRDLDHIGEYGNDYCGGFVGANYDDICRTRRAFCQSTSYDTDVGFVLSDIDWIYVDYRSSALITPQNIRLRSRCDTERLSLLCDILLYARRVPQYATTQKIA